jgi:cell division protein FtsZ
VIPLQPPVARVIDPAVAQDEPLFAPNPFGEDRREKTGWSLFGNRRPKAQAQSAPPRSAGGAQPAAEAFEEEDSAQRDDLEIPSFLRRLAN